MTMTDDMRETLKKLRLSAKHLTQAQIDLVPESNWYKYTLQCDHEVYTRTRIKAPQSYHEHFIRCPKCQQAGASPTNWNAVVKMEAVTDEHVSNVLDGTSFVLPRRILRTDGHSKEGNVIPSGNPLPYTTGDRDY